MAEHAHIDSAARSPMEGKLIVTCITARGPNDIVNLRHGSTVRNEVVGRAGVAGAEIVRGQIARAENPDGMRRRRIEPRWRFRVEDVLILARSNIGYDPAVVTRRIGEGAC